MKELIELIILSKIKQSCWVTNFLLFICLISTTLIPSIAEAQNFSSISYNGFDSEGKKSGYWIEDSLVAEPYILRHYINGKTIGPCIRWLNMTNRGDVCEIVDITYNNYFYIYCSFKKNKPWYIFSNNGHGNLISNNIRGKRKYENYGYRYEFADNGSLSKEGFFLWEDSPDYYPEEYGESILYDSSGFYSGIYNSIDGKFYSKEDLSDSSTFRIPQNYVEKLSLEIAPLYYDNSVLEIRNSKNGRNNGYYRHFNTKTKQYNLIGEYCNGEPSGIWLFFYKKRGTVNAIVYKISQNKTIELERNDGSFFKPKYKGYMLYINKNNMLESEGWILFDSLIFRSWYKFSVWIKYENEFRDYEGVYIYGSKIGVSPFFIEKQKINNSFRFYPPIYEI